MLSLTSYNVMLFFLWPGTAAQWVHHCIQTLHLPSVAPFCDIFPVSVAG